MRHSGRRLPLVLAVAYSMAAWTAGAATADPARRRAAILALHDLDALGMEHLAAAINDQGNTALRLIAARILARMPRSEARKALLERALKDGSEAVRTVASRVLNAFPFYRETVSIREHADQVVHVVQTIPLPIEGWTLKFDERGSGHVQGWFEPKMADADWQTVRVLNTAAAGGIWKPVALDVLRLGN